MFIVDFKLCGLRFMGSASRSDISIKRGYKCFVFSFIFIEIVYLNKSISREYARILQLSMSDIDLWNGYYSAVEKARKEIVKNNNFFLKTENQQLKKSINTYKDKNSQLYAENITLRDAFEILNNKRIY